MAELHKLEFETIMLLDQRKKDHRSPNIHNDAHIIERETVSPKSYGRSRKQGIVISSETGETGHACDRALSAYELISLLVKAESDKHD
jgi:hypothetical protein